MGLQDSLFRFLSWDAHSVLTGVWGDYPVLKRSILKISVKSANRLQIPILLPIGK